MKFKDIDQDSVRFSDLKDAPGVLRLEWHDRDQESWCFLLVGATTLRPIGLINRAGPAGRLSYPDPNSAANQAVVRALIRLATRRIGMKSPPSGVQEWHYATKNKGSQP